MICLLSGQPASASASAPDDLFSQGFQAYVAGQYEQAARCFSNESVAHPSAGALHNLGNAEWKCGRTGPAILAWERARALSPYQANTLANLRFARKLAQLDPPELAWYETCSTWLPLNAWGWIAAGSFWLAAALIVLPGVLHWRKCEWHQGLAAIGFAVFLVVLPALYGVHTRSHLGVILPKETYLKLTPTPHGQNISKLSAGEIVRVERQRGDFLFVRSGTDQGGWVGRGDLGWIYQM